jgi:archaellum biogenesis protein FlaJ (TadC family)
VFDPEEFDKRMERKGKLNLVKAYLDTFASALWVIVLLLAVIIVIRILTNG